MMMEIEWRVHPRRKELQESQRNLRLKMENLYESVRGPMKQQTSQPRNLPKNFLIQLVEIEDMVNEISGSLRLQDKLLYVCIWIVKVGLLAEVLTQFLFCSGQGFT